MNLIALRKSKNIEIADLATLLKVDEKLIKEWEFGVKMPSIEHLETIASFYGVTASDLFLPMRIAKAKGASGVSKLDSSSSQESQGRFVAWLTLSIIGFVVTVLILSLAMLPFYNLRFSAWVPWNPWVDGQSGAAKFSFYDMAFEDGGFPFLILFFIILLIVAIWDIVSFILHLVGRVKGNTYKFVNAHVSRTLQIVGAVVLFAMCLTFTLDAVINNKDDIIIPSLVRLQLTIQSLVGAYLMIALVSLLTAIKIAAACLLKWRTK